MEYAIIRDITDEQMEKIKKEFNRGFSKDCVRMVLARGREIGFCTTCEINGYLTLEYYLFREYQHQGYGNIFVYLVSDYIACEHKDHSILYLLIHKENIPSLKVAQKSGYKFDDSDWDFRAMINDDMPEYYLLSKSNKYYQNRSLKKAMNN